MRFLLAALHRAPENGYYFAKSREANCYTSRMNFILLQLRFLVCIAVVAAGWSVSFQSVADTTAPYSKPFHKQGRGWYPSIYWSTGRNFGSYYLPNETGRPFEELKDTEWNPEENGLIYFYRPYSQWADEEVEAPSYYLNDELVFNLRSGSWTVVELPAGSYDFAVRKSFLPMLGFESFDDKLMMAFDMNLQADIGLEIDPGKIFYIRHSEESLPKQLHPDLAPDDEMASADVQLVSRDLAMEEMPHTRFLDHTFWTSNDSDQAEELLNGEMQDYGWFSVIWPWSNNFLWGFPIWYLPSDMYRELKGEDNLTLEQELYFYHEDVDAYLAEIERIREPQMNWLAPWREPRRELSLNDELTLERLEAAARAGNIKPAPYDPDFAEGDDFDEFFWFNPFGKELPVVQSLPKPERVALTEREEERERILQQLN